MLSNRIESIISQSKLYGCLPSAVIGIEDAYTAYCFNEACAAIIIHIQDGEKPHYRKTEKETLEPKEYKRFSDYVKDVEG